MKVRDWLNDHSVLVTLAAIVILVAALFGIYLQNHSFASAGVRPVYFYDLASHKLVPEKSNKFPPLDTPGKTGAVRAYVYACGQCTSDDHSPAHIAWLETYTDLAKAELLKRPEDQTPPNAVAGGGSDAIIRKGHMVSARDPVKWVPFDSPEGYAVINAAAAKCGKQQPTACEP